ncbi:hypothetical protein M885DRAFT_499128 [Pelagophyceae sp. CCMP2097]|nr:hypothetical protein M885DRAFT_499128 [Pelagophyceae sp. CCMP2097]
MRICVQGPFLRLVAVWWVAVLAAARAAPAPAPTQSPTTIYDIFMRKRITECGAGISKNMSGADWVVSPQLRRKWSNSLAFDSKAFDSVDEQRSANFSVLWAIASLRSNAPRAAHVADLAQSHPYFNILNATDKGHPATMLAHYDALGLRAAWGTPYGPAAWWLTYLRFMAQLLASGADYGILLQDDAVLPPDFRKTMEMHFKRLEEPAHLFRRYHSFRLGAYDVGLVVSKFSAARIMGLACASKRMGLPTDHWQV